LFFQIAAIVLGCYAFNLMVRKEFRSQELGVRIGYNNISPLIFTPDGNFLVVRFTQTNHSVIKIWNTETGELIQTLNNLPSITITSLGVRRDKTIIACGIRENKISVWELQTDSVIYSVDEIAPCILSTDARILIYATVSYDIIIWDLVEQKMLNTLQGHTSAIRYLALSNDREFLASYDINNLIKVWGI
jgi:WD40 repeat protein